VVLQQHPHDSHAQIFRSLRLGALTLRVLELSAVVPFLEASLSGQTRLRGRTGKPNRREAASELSGFQLLPQDPLLWLRRGLEFLSHSDTRIEDISRGVGESVLDIKACATFYDLSLSTEWTCYY
jgi:hypothetical protein